MSHDAHLRKAERSRQIQWHDKRDCNLGMEPNEAHIPRQADERQTTGVD